MYTPLGPTYGTVAAPGGDLLMHPDDAKRLGLMAPDLGAPIDPAAMAPAPTESPVPDNATLAPPPDPMGPAPTVAPAAPVSLAPTDADAQQAAQLAADEAQRNAPPPPNLSATTYGDVLAEQQAALRDQAGADAIAAKNEAGYIDQQAAALETRNKAIAAKEAEFAEREQADQAKIAETTSLYEAKVKEFADAKVDRGKYKISPLQAIGVALSGIGSAYKGQGDKNPALDLLMRQIDQYVEDGYRAKASLGQEAGMYKDRLGQLQDQATNTVAQKQLAVAGITARTANEIEAVGQRMQAGVKRDSVLQLAANARAKGVDALGQAVQLQHAEDAQKAAREQAERESRRQAALGYARIKEDARQADMSYAAKLAEIEDQRSQRIAAATSKVDLEAATREIPDLKGADGSTYQARNEAEAAKLAKSFAATQTINDRISELMRMKAQYGDKAKAMKSAEWQKMQANVADIQNSLRTAFEMGTLDKGSLEQMGKLMGGDPMRDGAAEALLGNLWQDSANNGLQQLRKNVIDRFNTNAEAMRYPRGPKFQRWEPPKEPEKAATDRIDTLAKDIQGDKTPDQIIASAKPGAFWSAAGRVVGDGDSIGGRRATNQERGAIAKVAQVGEGGLNRVTKTQRAAIDELALTAKTDKPEAARAKATLIGLATGPREDVAAAALETLATLGDADALNAVADARAAAVKGGKAPVSGARELSQQEAADAERAAVAQTAKTAAAQKAIASGTSPLTLLADRARAGDKAAIAGLERLSRGGDAADIDLGVIKGNATTKKIAMRELEAILSSKGR